MLFRIVLILICIQFSSPVEALEIEPVNKVKDLIELADEFSNPSESLIHLNEALLHLHGVHDTLKSKLYYKLGVAHGKLYNTDSSKIYFNEVLTICEKTGDKNLRVAGYNGLGNIARTLSNNKEAAQFFQKGMEIAESEDSESFLDWRARLLGNIGGIFFDMEDYQAALEYSKQGLLFAEKIGAKRSIAISHTQIGYSYSAMEKTDSALMHNKKAAKILEELQDSSGLIYQYYNIGGIYKKRNNFKLAEYYYNQCVKLAKPYGEAETYISSLYQLGTIALAKGNLPKADNYALQALEKAKRNNLLPASMDTYSLLYLIAKKRRKFEQALDYRNQQIALRDSLKDEETLRKINDFKVKYETAEKERVIGQLNAQNQVKQLELDRRRLYQKLLIGIILLIFLIAIYVYRVQRNKNTLREEVMFAELSELRIRIKELLGKYEGKIEIDLQTLNEKLMNPLSEREYDVLALIFSQKSNQEIADALFVSINTVKTHLKNVYTKLGVSNRKEALEAVFKS